MFSGEIINRVGGTMKNVMLFDRTLAQSKITELQANPGSCSSGSATPNNLVAFNIGFEDAAGNAGTARKPPGAGRPIYPHGVIESIAKHAGAFLHNGYFRVLQWYVVRFHQVTI